MSDPNVSAAAQHFDAEEAANEQACYGAAHAHGISPAQADLCDDGDQNCPSCPFKRHAGKHEGNQS